MDSPLNRDYLEKLFVDMDMTPYEIAEYTNTPPKTIQKLLVEYGLLSLETSRLLRDDGSVPMRGDLDLAGGRLINVSEIVSANDLVENVRNLDIMDRDINMGSHRVINLANPTTSYEGATKNYVDALIEALRRELLELQFQGEWYPVTTYYPGDVVVNSGVLYVCLTTNTNREPPESPYWETLTQLGGIGIVMKGPYDSDANYNVRDAVTYQGSSYYCWNPCQNNLPTDTDYWLPIALKGEVGINWKTDPWSDIVDYFTLDGVYHEGQSFIALQNNLNHEPPVNGDSTWRLLAKGSDHTQGTDQGLDTGGPNALTAAEIKNTVDDRHSQGTDQGLDTGGPNAVTAAQAKVAYTASHTRNADQKLDEGGANEVTAAQVKTAVNQSHSNALDHSNSLDHQAGHDQYLDQGGVNQCAVADVKDAISKKHAAAGDDNFASLSEKTTPDGSMKVPVNDGTYGFMTRQNFLLGVKGGINFITNSDFEGDTVGQVPAGWGTYKDAAQATPEDGTGGSPSVTFLASDTVILNGGKSARITKPASNCQGEGINFLFDVPKAYRGGMVRIQLPYIPVDAIAIGDFTVWIYDATNAALIQPTPYQVEGRTAGTPGAVVAEFQAPYNMAQGRLLWHVATTSASQLRVDVDEIQVGPGSRVFGPAESDWEAKTFTGSWTSNTTYTGFVKRVGDYAFCQVEISCSGAPTSTTLVLTMPSGMTIDTTKLPSNVQSLSQIPGNASLQDSGTKLYTSASVVYYSTTQVQPMYDDGSGGAVAITQAAPFTFANGDKVYLFFRVPVLGWGSCCQMSSDAETRVVEASAYLKTNNQTANANAETLIVFNTKRKDTHNAFNTATGVFTCPIPGIYRISFRTKVTFGGTAPSSLEWWVYKNAAAPYRGYSVIDSGMTANKSMTIITSTEIECNAGDTIGAYALPTGQAIALVATGSTSDTTSIDISRISGPIQIAASEKVHVIASTAAGQNITAAGAVVVFGTKSKDSHGAYNAATGRFTAPRYGVYHIDTFIATVSYSGTTGTTVEIKLLKSDNSFKIIGATYEQNGVNAYWKVKGSGDIELNAGEGFDIIGISNCGTKALVSEAAYNWLTISG